MEENMVSIPVGEYFEGVHAIALLNAVVDVLEVNDIPEIFCLRQLFGQSWDWEDVMMWTDNPIRDAERQTEESLPVCQVCGKQIRDEYCYQYDPDDIETCMCEDCVNKAVHTIKPGLLQDIVSDFLSDFHTATPLKEGD